MCLRRYISPLATDMIDDTISLWMTLQHVINGTYYVIRLMHESAIGGHDQWLPRCRSNIGIGNEIVGSFLLVLNSMALYAIWNMLTILLKYIHLSVHQISPKPLQLQL